MFLDLWLKLHQAAHRADGRDDRNREDGEIAGWVLVVLMTSALVVAVWGVARERLVDIVSTSLETVCGSIGC